MYNLTLSVTGKGSVLQKKCIGCGRHYDRRLFECPDCAKSSHVLVSVNGPEHKNDAGYSNDAGICERGRHKRIPHYLTLMVVNAVALLVIFLLEAGVDFSSEPGGGGPMVVLYAFVVWPVYALIGLINLGGLVGAGIVALVHRRFWKSAALLMLSVLPALIWVLRRSGEG